MALLLVVLGFVALFAHQRGWLPLEVGQAQTGSLAEISAERVNLIQESVGEKPPQWDVVGDRTLSPERPVEVADQIPPVSLAAISDESFRRPSFAVSNGLIQQVSNELAVGTSSEPPAAAQANERASEPAQDDSSNASSTEPAVRVANRPKESSASLDFKAIDEQIKAGNVLEAHKALSRLYWKHPESRLEVQERIDLTAKAIYFSPQPHVQEPYLVQPGDQLRKIATKYQVPWEFLARLNRIDPKRLREGQRLKVINGPFGAIVTLGDFEVTVHHAGLYVRRYPCCIGKGNSSPVGKFKVLNKVTNPQYTDPDGKVFRGGDRENPLGTHWIDLGDSYGIHGTIDPNSIGRAESRGCIRLLNSDVAEVYDLLDLGSEVVIRP
jgi:lipoprotein-anchoring transpeptidase ErfK/SrfK